MVELKDFMLPASQRLELGREDPDSYRERWFDYPALAREVLAPLAARGPAQSAAAAARPRTDRSVRAQRRIAAKLRSTGRPAEVVELKDFMLPASQRLELG
ncbi:hypothetical protein CTI14_54160, partial [Methylobacterium radiotolerans]